MSKQHIASLLGETHIDFHCFVLHQFLCGKVE